MIPVVSVIIPTYNRSDKLKRAIESVLKQTFNSFEIIVCDDGSTDDTKKVVFSILDDRIIYIDCGKNGRPAIPRNMGINAAKGEWIAFLDDDDYWLENKLEIQLDYLNKYKLSAASTNGYKIIDGIISVDKMIEFSNYLIKFNDLLLNNYVINSSTVVKKELLLETGGFPEEKIFRGIEDYLLWFKISTLTDIVFVNEGLMIYNDEPSTSIRYQRDFFEIYKEKLIILDGYLKWVRFSKNNKYKNNVKNEIFRLKIRDFKYKLKNKYLTFVSK